ncbi:phosphate ABC transporter substrate-binding protein PstS [Segnochrobactraceae bacterium EtOH-i3]
MPNGFLKTAVAALAGLMMLGGAAQAQSQRITGAGASFPFPLYSAWFQAYGAKNKDTRIEYQSVGSGAGVKNFIARIVDFGASDAAMTDEQMAEVKGGALVLPMTAGEIVLAYNLPGVKDLRLPRAVYPAIFSGAITRWNDPAIVAANPGVTLPDLPITVVRRSDSSGTTFVFTQHLSAIDPAFKEKVGAGTTVQWPAQSTFIGAPRNDGITATVMQTPGAIGYIEYGYAKLTKTPFAALENKSGKFISAGDESGQAALASAEFNGDDLRVWVTDPANPEAYPIATFTWMLFYKDSGKPEIAAKLRDFVEWALGDGQKMASDLGYIPMPEVVVEKVRAQVPDIK